MTTQRILLVEDEENIRELLFDFLADAGFEIVQAETGDSAFRLLERDNLQLLLTDINMPGHLDGIELAQLARVAHPDLPVVFITGKPDAASRARALPMPVAILNKPFNLGHLLATVREMAASRE